MLIFRWAVKTKTNMDDLEQMSMEMSTKTGGMTGFLDMPVEIVEHIFASTIVEYTDVLNASLVCAKIHDVCKSNKIWRHKLCQR